MAGPDSAALRGIVDWLVAESLAGTQMARSLGGLVQLLRGAGLPLGRAHLTYNTLHPLHDGQALTWTEKAGVSVERFAPRRGPPPEEWLRSPVRHVIVTGTPFLRRRIGDPASPRDFPLLGELAGQGYTDYLLFARGYASFIRARPRPGDPDFRPVSGMILSLATRRPGGFSDGEIAGLDALLPHIALMTKVINQAEIARSLAECYIGREAGWRVLEGAIDRGDFISTEAVVWLSDLADSTELAATLPRQKFVSVLNGFFDRTAGVVEEEGGEPLTFIGDGALAIFPIDRLGAAGARSAALSAARRAVSAMALLNAGHAASGERPLGFGIALHAGRVDYGNVGVPSRLAWSVIGPVVNETARLERLTRTLAEPVLASASFVDGAGEGWRRLGAFSLQGVKEPFEAFAPPLQ